MEPETISSAAGAAASMIPLSQIAMAGGFGLVAGYAIGIALKKILIFFMFFMGIILFAVIVLQYNGLIGSVNWEAMSAAFDSFAASGREGMGNLFHFAIQNIAGAAAGTAGLIAAWKIH